jgi:hypothetical protein
LEENDCKVQNGDVSQMRRLIKNVTIKGQGRMQMDEVAVYEVRDGKIMKEQFFY